MLLLLRAVSQTARRQCNSPTKTARDFHVGQRRGVARLYSSSASANGKPTDNLRKGVKKEAGHKLANVFERFVKYHESQLRTPLQANNQVPMTKKEQRKEAVIQATIQWQWLGEHVESLRAHDSQNSVSKGKLYSDLIDRIMLNHEPMAYILGNQPFGPLTIRCAPPTLIPRPETEALTEHVAELVLKSVKQASSHQRTLRILDLCSGTGCIGILLHHLLQRKLPDSIKLYILGVDAVPSAVELARKNCDFYQTEHGGDLGNSMPICIEKGDLFIDEEMQRLMDQHGPFDIVMCNPPYIPEHEWNLLDLSVKQWEDRTALVGEQPGKMQNDMNDNSNSNSNSNNQGLAFYTRICSLLQRKVISLNDDSNRLDQLPLIAVEVGHDQAKKVRRIFEQANLSNIQIWTDPYDVERAVLANGR